MVTYDHGCKSGGGSRLTLDIKPAIDTEAGAIVFTIHKQSPDYRGIGYAWTADDYVAMSVRIQQLSALLEVLDGVTNEIKSGHGIRMKEEDGTLSMLHVDYMQEPFCGYAMHIQNNMPDGRKLDGRILLTLREATNIRDIIKSSFSRLAFGE